MIAPGPSNRCTRSTWDAKRAQGLSTRLVIVKWQIIRNCVRLTRRSDRPQTVPGSETRSPS